MMWVLVALFAADGGVVDAGVKAATGPAPEVRLECAPSPVKIGQKLTCTLQAAHANDVSISVLAPPELVATDAGPATPGPTGNLITTRVFTQQVLSMKPLKITGLTVVWHESDGGEGRAPVPEQKILVESVLADVQEPKFATFEAPEPEDAATFSARRGPTSMPVTNWPLIVGLWILAGLIVGIGAGVAIKRWRDARFVDEGPWVDPRPAHVIAYEKLDALTAEDLPGHGELMAYYVRLSEIVRDYLERRFRFPALEMTSEEIRAQVERMGLAREGRQGVADFLTETDLVKFADFAPSASEVDTVLKQAYGVVATTQVPGERRESTA